MSDNEINSSAILAAQIEELTAELILVKKALVSLGSHIAAGGPPGIKFFLAWFQEQTAPKPAPVSEQAPQPTPAPELLAALQNPQVLAQLAAALSSTAVSAPATQAASTTSSPNGMNPAAFAAANPTATNPQPPQQPTPPPVFVLPGATSPSSPTTEQGSK
jgi:hypothetical protein